MKIKLFIRATMLFIIILIVGCSKESSEEEEKTNYVSGTVGDMVMYYRDNNLIEYDEGSQYGDVFYLSTKCESGRRLEFYFPKAVGKYMLSDGMIDLYCTMWSGNSGFSCSGSSEKYEAGDYQIPNYLNLLVSNEHKIKGEFSFTVKRYPGGGISYIYGEFEVEF